LPKTYHPKRVAIPIKDDQSMFVTVKTMLIPR
jgi:hypothetical protein